MTNKRIVQNKRKRHSPLKAFLLLGLLLLIPGFLYWQHLLTNRPTTGAKPLAVELAFAEKANQALQTDDKNKKLPLILQKDTRWGNLSYGTESSNNDLAHNGCALVSLAMIQAYWEHTSHDPRQILNWAGNRYYVTGQGTSWEIFGTFADNFGYQFKNLLTSFDSAYELMQQGIPVIVSVAPGTFTTTGHIMVLTTRSDGTIQVYDPNDSPEKNHYRQTFPKEVFLNEALNYWALWR